MPVDWDALHADYRTQRSAEARGLQPAKPFECPAEVFAAIANPSESDLRWLAEALHDGRFWFAVQLIEHSGSLGDAIFPVLLDAAIDWWEPSGSGMFIHPCIKAFGPRRVNESLLEVLQSGSDRRKAGAANALYWAHPIERWSVGIATFLKEIAMPEPENDPDGMSDVWERRQRLLLETFVSNSNLEVRQSILGILDLDPTSCRESHRPLVEQAIAIARSSEDKYLRHRVEIQIGTPREVE